MFRQLDLQIERMGAGAKQDGDLAERHAFVPKLFYSLGNEARLLAFVVRGDEHGGRAFRRLREQAFAETFSGVAYESIGYVENRLRAAEDLFELDNPGLGKE